MIKTSTCTLCEAACGILVDVDGDQVRSVRGDPDDPSSRGYICPKAAALVDLQHDPDRIRQPMIRDGSQWREVSWDAALERAGEGLRRIRRQHGRDAVAIYYGNPVAHNLGLMTHALPFSRALRTRNVYSASSADQLPQMLVALRMFGHLAVIPVPDVDRTDFFLILGANPAVSNGSLMTAPNIGGRIRAIRERGGRVVVIDPRRTETAQLADEHIAIRPGTDALLLAAMLHVLFAERRITFGALANAITNADGLEALVRELPPERVAGRTRVPVDTIRRLAREFAAAPRAACYGRVGMCTQRLGTLASWLVQALNLATGRVDTVGGLMFPSPAIDVVRVMSRLGMRGSYDRWRSRARGLPEFGGDPPVATLADEIEMPGRGQVRALITIAGNPVLSAPNGSRLDRNLASLEHVVAIDPFLNETTRHAHVLLPPAPPLSRAHYDLALSAFAVRNFAKYSEPAVPRAASERHDWEIVAELAARTFAPRPLQGIVAAVLHALHPERLLSLLLRAGSSGLSLDTLRQSPHGLDLGPLEPGRLASRMGTRDGKIDLAPADFVREARHELFADAERNGSGDLVLIGRRQLRSKNSWLHNSQRLVKGPARCTLLVHPDDAAVRGLSPGDLAELQSEAGTALVSVEVTDTILSGVVSLPHGWGHDRTATRMRVAAMSPGVSVNDVTSDRHLDTLSGNAAFNGLAVTLRRVSAA